MESGNVERHYQRRSAAGWKGRLFRALQPPVPFAAVVPMAVPSK